MSNIKTKRIFSIVLALMLAITLFAFPLTGCGKREEVYYTVTFDANGGTSVESQRVKSGKKATRPKPLRARNARSRTGIKTLPSRRCGISIKTKSRPT